MIINMLTPSPPANVNATSSVIQLAPASAAFVADRTTTLGSWVMAAFMDCILMGVIACQLATFGTAYRAQRHAVHRNRLQRFYLAAAAAVAFLSVLKTVQAIAVVWMQSVYYFADPDAARGLVASAWWQVTMPLMTGIIGCVVQAFFCTRFFFLCGRWLYCVPIVCAMCVGLAGGCLSVYSIVTGREQAKVMWLLVHLSGVFTADLLITAGTLVSLRRRTLGLPWATQLMHRVSRMVWESAVPPTVIATTDLILTQVLGPKLLWHLFANAALGKVYAISLLYTVNSVYEIRGQDRMSISIVSGHGLSRSFGASHRRADTADIELSTRTRTRSPTRSPRKSAQLTLHDGAGAPPPNTAVNLARLNSATTKPTLTMGQHLDSAALSDETLQLDVENQ